MTQLAILLTRHHRLLSVAAILDVLETVNQFYKGEGRAPVFDIRVLQPGDEAVAMYSRYAVQPLNTVVRPRLILVPAFLTNDLTVAINDNQECLGWLNCQYRQGTAIASFCTGAFLLGAAGLLNNKTATTHIDATGAFAAAFPQVNLMADAVVTQDQQVYTSGGATNTFHLLLKLIEEYCGRDMAIRTAKYFAIDMDRVQQGYFGTFQPVETHQDVLVGQLQQRIKQAYAQVNTLEELLSDIPASRRNLVRRFKQVTRYTPIEYLQKTRIEAAKKCLEQSSGGVLESMVASGYSDEKAFRLLFKKNVGITPSAYRSKYNRKAAEKST